jgi:hypothetical protein
VLRGSMDHALDTMGPENEEVSLSSPR